MINIVMLVGRLVSDPEIVERGDNGKFSRITLAVNRKFKDKDGIFQTDFIDCVLWNNIAVNVGNYCHKGDLIGVRGRLQVDVITKDDVKKKYIDVVAENITFLSKAKNDNEDNDIEINEE